DRPGIAATIFGALAKEGVNVDMIIQSEARGKTNDISFTIESGDLKKTLPVLEKVREQLGAQEVMHHRDVAKIAIVGVGMRSHPGVAATMFKTLAVHKINIQ